MGELMYPAAFMAVAIAFTVVGTSAAQDTTRAEELRAMRMEKAVRLSPPDEPGSFERLLDRVEGFQKGRGGRETTAFLGVRPKIGGLKPGAGIAGGIQVVVPVGRDADLEIEADAVASLRRYWGLGLRARYRYGSATVLTYGRYRHLPQERFYGVGAASEQAARSDYRLNEAVAGAILGAHVSGGLSVGARGAYIVSMPGPGRNDDVPDAVDRFAGDVPSLLSDARHAAVGGWIEYDGRDGAPDGPFYRYVTATESDVVGVPLAADRGIYALAELVRYAGLGDATGFSRLHLQSQQFIPLGRGRNVLAFREYAAFSAAGADHIPLYMLPSLGGAYTLRGYEDFRFRDRHAVLLNAEYRWQVWLFLDMAVFLDAGRVFGRVSDFSPGRLDGSYGAGLRLRAFDRGLGRIDVARSEEGTQVHVRLGATF